MLSCNAAILLALAAVSTTATPSSAGHPSRAVHELSARQWTRPSSTPVIYDENGNEITVNLDADGAGQPEDTNEYANPIEVPNYVPGSEWRNQDGARAFLYAGRFDGTNQHFSPSCGEVPGEDVTDLPAFQDCIDSAAAWCGDGYPTERDLATYQPADGRQTQVHGSCVTVWYPDAGLDPRGPISGFAIFFALYTLLASCQAGPQPEQFVSRYSFKEVPSLGVLSLYRDGDVPDGVPVAQPSESAAA